MIRTGIRHGGCLLRIKTIHQFQETLLELPVVVQKVQHPEFFNRVIPEDHFDMLRQFALKAGEHLGVTAELNQMIGLHGTGHLGVLNLVNWSA